METFQHCRDKHSVVSDTTNLGVYPTHMTISVFPLIDAHFFFSQGQLMASTSMCQCGAGTIDSHTVSFTSPMDVFHHQHINTAYH